MDRIISCRRSISGSTSIWAIVTMPPQAIIDSVKRVASGSGMVLVLCGPQGTPNVSYRRACQIKLAFPSMFCATIALSGPGRTEVLRVAVDAYEQAHEADAWSFSTHQVGRGAAVGC